MNAAERGGDQPGGDPDGRAKEIGRVTAMVRTRVGVAVADPDADLLSSGIIDSLSFVTLLLAIEQEYGIPIDVARMDLDDVRSVTRIAAFIERELAERAGPSTNGRPA